MPRRLVSRSQIRKQRRWQLAAVVALGLALSGASAFGSGDHQGQVHAPAASSGGTWTWLMNNSVVARLVQGFEEKLRHAANLDQDNAKLRKRLAELEAENLRLVHDAVGCREQTRAQQIKNEALAEGGVESSRTIASLRPADERLLKKKPSVIFDEASKAFEHEDFETAAKAFSHLIEHVDDEDFQDAQTHFLVGVSLYKVGNYKQALAYLNKSVERAQGDRAPSSEDQLSYAPRALGWMALAYKRLGDRASERKVIRTLIDKFPKSKEARRLNRNALG